MSDISKNIKRNRIKLGLTQQELADRLHVTRQAVSSWENGKNQPDLQTIELLSKELEVGIEELICGQPVRNKKKLILRAVILLTIAVLYYIQLSWGAEYMNKWMSTHYVMWPSVVFNCVLCPVLLLVSASAAISTLQIFADINVKQKKRRAMLRWIGCVMSIVLPLFWVLYLWSALPVTSITYGLFMGTWSTYPIWFLLSGILIYFGCAKEPDIQ